VSFISSLISFSYSDFLTSIVWLFGIARVTEPSLPSFEEIGTVYFFYNDDSVGIIVSCCRRLWADELELFIFYYLFLLDAALLDAEGGPRWDFSPPLVFSIERF
jgi:hypothetical protein